MSDRTFKLIMVMLLLIAVAIISTCVVNIRIASTDSKEFSYEKIDE
jgi:hypothetical protein